MFRSNFDHPQGDSFFTSFTKNKIIWFVVACLLYLFCFVLMLFLVWLLLYSLSLGTEVKKKNISLRMVKV